MTTLRGSLSSFSALEALDGLEDLLNLGQARRWNEAQRALLLFHRRLKGLDEAIARVVQEVRQGENAEPSN